jgi:hypothetical protein
MDPERHLGGRRGEEWPERRRLKRRLLELEG